MLTHIHSGIRRLWEICAFVVAPWFLLVAETAWSQEADPDDLINVSYIHAAILGTGTYSLNNRRVTMLRAPFSWKQREETPESMGWRWLAPVVLGYDDLSDVDSDFIEALLPDQLVTLSVMPGIELIFPIRKNWYLKPFVEVGGGRDFGANENFVLTHLGLRSLTLFDLSERWRMQLGAGLRWAAEYQFNSEDSNAFGLSELGLDLRRDLPWRLFEQQLDLGAYYVYQRYLPRFEWGESESWDAEAREVHEFGLSLGVPQGRKILGINVRRVRVGYKKGGQFQGWTFGTEFPF